MEVDVTVLLWIIAGVLAIACLISVGYAECVNNRVNAKFHYTGSCDEQSKHQQRQEFLLAIRHQQKSSNPTLVDLIMQQRPFWDDYVYYYGRICTLRTLGYTLLAVAIFMVAFLVD